MGKGSDIIQKNVNVIPQVFYDIIARIVPGMILIGSGVIVHLGPDEAIVEIEKFIGSKDTINTISFSFGAALILSSYFLSLVIMGFRHFAKRHWDKLFKKDNKDSNSADQKTKDSNTGFFDFFSSRDEKWKHNYLKVSAKHPKVQNEDRPSLHFVYDYIRIHAPGIGARLVKLQAECHMCSVLCIGFFALIIWNGVKVVSGDKGIVDIFKSGFEWVLIVAWVGIYFLKKELENRYTRGLSDSWFILH